MQRITFLIIAFFLFCQFSYTQAQQAVKGVVMGNGGEPLEYINVVAKSLPDSTFIAGVVTDREGAFSFESLPKNSCLSFSSIGYETSIYPATEEMSIILKETSIELKSLVVKANRPQIRLKDGALEMNVKGSVLSHHSDIINLLGQVPGLRATPEGGVGLIAGGRLMIFLNGREVRQMDELRTIDIKSIKSLRIDNAPGARYPSDVRAVLHIRTLRDLSALSVRLESWTRQATYLSNSEEAYISYSRGKMNFYGMASYGFYQKINEQDWKTTISETQGTNVEERLSTDLINRSNNRSLDVMAGVDFTPVEKITLGLKYTFNREGIIANVKDDSHSYIGTLLNDHVLSQTRLDNITLSHHVNAFSSWQITPKLNLTLNADFFGKKKDKDQNSTEQSLIHHTTTPIAIYSFTRHSLWQGNAILGYDLGKGRTAEIGAEVNNIGGDSHQLYGLERKRVSDYTNAEKIYAGFASYNFDWSGWSTQLGLRYEYAESGLYNHLVAGKDILRSWSNLFYTAKVSGNIGKTMHIFSLKSGIERPTMEQLSNNTFRSNQYLKQEGNPYLVPERSYDFGYNLIYSNYYLSASYTYYQDYMETYIRANREVPSGYIVSSTNYRQAGKLQIIANMRQKWDWYNLSVTGFFQYHHVKGEKQLLFVKPFPLYYLRLNNGFSLPKGYYIDLEYSYQSPTTMKVYLVGRKHLLNLYANKEFFDGKLQLSLRLNNILRSRNQFFTSMGGVVINQGEYEDSRSISLNIIYRFNKERTYKGKDTATEAIGRM